MRPKRTHRRNYNIPGQAHALTFSCYRRYELLSADRTCKWFCDAIEAAREEFDFLLWAYVFMPEHAHLLIFPTRDCYDIAVIRQGIKEPVGRHAFSYLRRYAPQWIPKLTRRRGNRDEHLFWQSGGGYDRNIDNGETLQAEIAYIHLNPVRRGLAERGTDWKWSSAAWYELGEVGPLPIDPIPPEWLA